MIFGFDFNFEEGNMTRVPFSVATNSVIPVGGTILANARTHVLTTPSINIPVGNWRAIIWAYFAVEPGTNCVGMNGFIHDDKTNADLIQPFDGFSTSSQELTRNYTTFENLVGPITGQTWTLDLTSNGDDSGVDEGTLAVELIPS